MKKIIIIVLSLLCVFISAVDAFAFWVWTPETKKWVNPKYAVQDTPEEQLKFAMSFIDAKDYERARSEFRKILTHYPHAPQAPEAQFYLGVCEEHLNNFYKAFSEYQKTIDSYPQIERMQEIIDRQYYIGEIFFAKKNKIAGISIGPDYEKALEIFKKVVANAPFSAFADAAQYKIGVCLKNNQLYEEAVSEFEKVEENYPYSTHVPSAKFELAYCRYKLSNLANNYDEQLINSSIEAFNNFLKDYPDSEFVPQAKKILEQLRDKRAQTLFRVAEFYERQNKPEGARLYYEDLINNYQDTAWAAQAISKLPGLKKK